MRPLGKSPSDEVLMKRFIQGDDRAFSMLTDRYAKPIFRFVFSMTLNVDDAEELVQDIFLRIVRAKHSFETREKFRPWLYGIARNHCLNFLKRKQRARQEIIQKEKPGIAKDAGSPREEAIKKEKRQQVEQALLSLDDKARELLHLRFYQGLSYKEIARVLGISENSVSPAIIRALKKLKDTIFEE